MKKGKKEEGGVVEMETWLRDDLGERKKRLKSKIEMGGLESRERK